MNAAHRFIKRMWGLVACLVLGLTACSTASLPPNSESSQVSSTRTVAPTEAPSPTPTVASLSSPTPVVIHASLGEATEVPTQASASATPLASDQTVSSTPAAVFYEPAGCWQPPDDYTRLSLNGHTLNARTAAMLQQAAQLYAGPIDVAGGAILQGSYTDRSVDGREAHLGGGEVDISVAPPQSSNVLYHEIEPLIRALRAAGFAAWLREEDVAYGPGMHIHAVAIGDTELSPAAQEQITGPAGYLRGYDGLPVTGADPTPDRYGGPLLCRWMVDAGYTDLRPAIPVPTPGLPWQERLRQAALAYEAKYPEDADQIARSLKFLDGLTESASNICGPLSGAILRDAGLLPSGVGPAQDLKSYWQSRPITNGRPWSLFPARDYEVFRFDTALAEFDFHAWPLQPGDFLYTYAKNDGFEHMFVVAEVDAEGRAYAVTNQYQIWGKTLILRYMLYDPNAPGEGIIYNEWSDGTLGRTGQGGFEVLRKRGLQAGSLYAYTVRPGDTLPELSARYGAQPESIAESNPGVDLANLQVGAPLTIPIPPYQPAPSQPAPEGQP